MINTGSWSNPDGHPPVDWDARKRRAEVQLAQEEAFQASHPAPERAPMTYEEELEAKLAKIRELAIGALGVKGSGDWRRALRDIAVMTA
jgi:hypothetical protein